jgi:hypothetical protein
MEYIKKLKESIAFKLFLLIFTFTIAIAVFISFWIIKKTNQITKTEMYEMRYQLLSEISRRNRKLEIVTSVKKFMDKKSSQNLKLMMNKDIWATDVYTLGFEYESKANLDYTHKLITP